ncbi:S-layer homology domain-containing protein [Aquibacillus albus]|uniref:SLH domain-containing protein n=1 Tax=Aquibacillus albus TaxID=1168171 RepID=A0ABS2N5K1_9BACI|nr:S-layer homology domain-containing protein [Aquibacillus albus]MBM7573416.1 hypothetical protein [Aquibacillus albus]
MKKVLIAVISSLTIFVGASHALANTSSFNDVTNYVEEINYLSSNDIIQGYGDGTFKPTGNVKRMQAVQMILNALDIEPDADQVEDPGFTDIGPGDYGYEYVAKAVELGFIVGKNNGSIFDPWAPLTRGQMAAILVNAFNMEGSTLIQFEDIPADHLSYEVINTLAANKITTGYPDGTFKPGVKLSREHFSVFLAKVLNPDLIPPNKGNEFGNILNSGNFTSENGWTYYGDQGISKWKSDDVNSVPEELSSHEVDDVFNMNVVYDWIYYINAYDQSIYKMTINGTEREKIVNGPAIWLSVVDDTMVYTKENKVYTANTDGLEEKELASGTVAHLYNDEVLYMNENAELHKVKLDGTEKQKIADKVREFDISGTSVYFINNEDNQLYKVNLDGTNLETVTNHPIVSFKVKNDWIYYTEPEEWHLYKMQKDGSSVTQLSDYPVAGGLMTLENQLAVSVYTQEYEYYWFVLDQDGNVQYHVGPNLIPEELR